MKRLFDYRTKQNWQSVCQPYFDLQTTVRTRQVLNDYLVLITALPVHETDVKPHTIMYDVQLFEIFRLVW